MTTALINDFIVRSGLVVQGTAVVTSSTGQVGAVQVDSGLAVAKNAFVGTTLAVGTDLTVGGNISLGGALSITGKSTLTELLVTGPAEVQGNFITSGTSIVYSTATFGSDVFVQKDLSVTGSLAVTAPSTLSGGLTVSNATTLTGTLAVTGVSNFNNNLFVNDGSLTVTSGEVPKFTVTSDGNVTASGTLGVTGLTSLNGGAILSAATVTNALEVGGTLGVTGYTNLSGGATLSAATVTNNLAVGGTLGVTGVTSIQDTTAATTNGLGALTVAGGAYVGNNLIVNSTAWNTTTNTSNALYVKGGGWFEKSLVVEGDALFKSNVVFSGTATYVFSTNTQYTDNLLDLHVPPGGLLEPWTVDDGKDIGHVYHYYKGADKRAFLGLANDTGWLEWYDNGTEGLGVFTGTSYGTFNTGDIVLTGTTNATSTVTGALRVAGGAGFGLDVYAGGGVSGSTVTARNLTDTRLVLAGTGGQLTDTASLTWNSGLSQVEGRIAYANTSTHLAGGAAGSLPYQTAENTTEFLGIGTNGYVLQSNGSVPVWGPASGVTAGSATTATNIANGQKDQIPYQSGPGATVFSDSLRFNGTVFTTTNAVLTGTDDTAGNATTGALQVAGGVGIAKSLWVGSSATVAGNLYVDGDIFLQGAGLNTISAQTGTFETVFVTGTTGTGLNVSGDAVVGRNLKVTGVGTFSNVVSTNGTITDLTATNASVTTLTASGLSALQGVTAGQVTATSISVTGQSTLQNATAATLTATNLVVTGATALQGELRVTGISTFSNRIVVANDTNSLSTTTGAITTPGGIGVGKDAVIGGTLLVGPTVANTVVPAVLSNNVLLSSFTSNSISGTAAQNLDTFSAATYRTARYTIQIVDGANIHVTEMTVFHNGTNVYLNEYGISTNNGPLGVFDANLSAGSVTLTFTPTGATAMVIKVVRLGITA